MSWVVDILNTIRGSTAANTKLIIDGFKELKDEYKTEARAAKDRANSMQQEISRLSVEVEKAIQGEARCHELVIKMSNELRDVKEELIFTRMLKSKQ